MPLVDDIQFTKRATDLGHYYTSSASKQHLRQYLRECSRTHLKTAAIGGDQEQGFEQAFASLAYSFLKDKAPRLLDYVVGFQLVDRNEDNTKAVGVYGFKVGDQWMYAPTFFLNGDMKGHELLYVKKQDSFVPMKENWINFLISRKPHELGEASPQDTWQLGGLPPDIYRLTHPPTSSKYGSDGAALMPEMQKWAYDALPFLAAAATQNENFFAKQANTNLESFVKEDFNLLRGAFNLTQRYPLVKRAFERFYGPDFFVKMGLWYKNQLNSIIPEKKATSPSCRMKKRKKRANDNSLLPATDEFEPLSPTETGELSFYILDKWGAEAVNDGADRNKVDENSPNGIKTNLEELTEDERQKLLRDTVLIKDKRDPHATSMVYNTQVKVELINPTQTGIYQVLEKQGAFDEMLVVFHPQTNKGREEYCTVIRMSDPRNWLNIHSSHLWVKASPEPLRPSYEQWFDKLEKKDSLETKGFYIALGANGAATTPFRVNETYGDGVYRVDFRDYCSYGEGRPKWMTDKRYDDYHGNDYYVSTYNAKLFINKREGTGLRSVSGELSIPKSFRFLKLKDPPKPPKKKDDNDLMSNHVEDVGDGGEGSEERPIQPGNLVDIQALFFDKTASLRVIDQGGEVWLKTGMAADERMTKKAALISLIRDHGCTEATARHILKEAAVKGKAVFRIKYAEPTSSMLQPGPGAPSLRPPLYGMERVGPRQVPAMYPQEEYDYIPDLHSSRTDPTIYDPFYLPDQKAMQTAQEAGNAGQKEVFDTSMISGMLKAVRQDSLVDRYLPDLMKGLDKCGRVLFMLYWHQEEFEDRYGKQDLPELEDSLRNAFETMGDVVLFLKEKQVGGGEGMDMVGGNAVADPNIDEAARN
jgi:hypothetical protein